MAELTVREVLESLGYRINIETQGFYKTSAIYRNGDNPTALSVNKDTGYWKDFVTQDSGNLEKLVKLTSGQIVEYHISKVDNSIQKLREEVNDTVIKEDQVYPLLPSYSFYNKRGVSNDTLKHYEAGLCTRGPLNDRIVFPIKDHSGKIVGWAGRDILENKNRPKWKLMGTKANWFYPSFYNLSAIKDSETVIIVEGISDILAMHEAGLKNVVCIFGLSISNKLLAEFLQLNPKRIVISLNNDQTPGQPGIIACNKLREKLIKWFNEDNVQIILPAAKDFGNMTKDQILEWAKTNNIKYAKD